MEEQGGDNMDTTRMMLDWAEQNYSNSQYTQDQVDGRYPGERVRISLRRGIQHYVIKFISDLRQVGGFLLVLCYLHYDTTFERAVRSSNATKHIGKNYKIERIWVRISLRRGIQHYVIKFISDLRQVGGFLLVLCYLHYDTTEILLKVALNTITL
jgi:hypothetical protein